MFEHVQVIGLPDRFDAIVERSDLQGMAELGTGQARLLGVAVAEDLQRLALGGVIASAERTGVLLAGDLYSVPAVDKRGGYGTVADVWNAFARHLAGSSALQAIMTI